MKKKFYIKEVYSEMMIETKSKPVQKESVLAEIRKKEEWAKDYLIKARDASKKYIISAAAKAEEIKQRGEAEINAEILRMREEKEKRLANEMARIESETEKKVALLREKVKANTEKTVDYVIKAILEAIDALS